jgi:type IV pilus assembly protein PilA
VCHSGVSFLQKGFTLLELMIVVAIIGILASLALPAYQDYTVRAKMSEVVLALSSCRVSITEVYQSGPETAPGANGWGCESGASVGTKYVSSVTTSVDGVATATVRGIAAAVNNSVVTLTPLAPPAPGTPATFTPATGQRLYGWRCGSTADGTSVPTRYLPASCRG